MSMNPYEFSSRLRRKLKDWTYFVIEHSFRIGRLIWALRCFSFPHSWSRGWEYDSWRGVSVDFTSEFSTLCISCLLASSLVDVLGRSLVNWLRFLGKWVFIQLSRVLEVLAWAKGQCLMECDVLFFFGRHISRILLGWLVGDHSSVRCFRKFLLTIVEFFRNWVLSLSFWRKNLDD